MDQHAIFEKAAGLLDTGKNVALVTVSNTKGSTPGKVGYRMLVWKAGHSMGTVGGGLVEAEVALSAAAMLGGPDSRCLRFELADLENERGICGGEVEFLVETFDPTWQPWFRRLSDILTRGDRCVIVTTILQGQPPQKVIIEFPFSHDEDGLSPEVRTSIERLFLQNASAERMTAGEDDILIENIARRPRLVIFGAGHISQHICTFAKQLDFEVTICDDRISFANERRFPTADHIVVGPFADFFSTSCIDSGSYIVIVTRGHKCDEAVLECAADSEAGYVGMIGSIRKTRAIIDNLRRKGIADSALAGVYSPIGIDIGALTPEEIALSIICEIVKVRRLGPHAGLCHMKDSSRQRLPETRT